MSRIKITGHSKGPRRGTRDKLRLANREKSLTIKRFLQEMENSTRATISINPAFPVGMPHARFNGRSGIIEKKQGKCYVLKMKDGNKEKELIVHPVHLKRL
jgi:large subunit ribosomal protein L21e